MATQLELYWTSGRVPASEMAVMYRTNAQSRSFEEACLRKALPFIVVGAQRFYERREVTSSLIIAGLSKIPVFELRSRESPDNSVASCLFVLAVAEAVRLEDAKKERDRLCY